MSKIRDISCYDINVRYSYVTPWKGSFKTSSIQIPCNFPVFTKFEKKKKKDWHVVYPHIKYFGKNELNQKNIFILILLLKG